MVSSFIPPSPNKTVEFSPVEIPINVGGDGRYIYVLNCVDQTVSVIDGASGSFGAVVATINLTSSKNFLSCFYRSLDLSVWVLGTSYFNRIDANPSSGSFNTVIESGATAISQNLINSSYITWPFDTVVCAAGNIRWVPIRYINNATEAAKVQNWMGLDSTIKGQTTFGHDPGRNTILHPKSKVLEVSENGSIAIRFADIQDFNKKLIMNSPYTLKGSYYAADLAQSMIASYLFGNFTFAITTTACYVVLRDYEYSPIQFGHNPNMSLGVTNFYFLEYDPIAKRCIWGSKYPGTPITEVWNIAKGSITSVGTLDRNAYAASGEDSTDDIMYCPYNGLTYVKGQKFGAGAGINKIHVYDLRLALGSMYLGSIAVGSMDSAGRSGNHALNAMTMNRTRYREAVDVMF